ncbi:DUF2029 domain-containing protein [bacterium]|nr:DUF2029 domain-containing protein [bacterium]
MPNKKQVLYLISFILIAFNLYRAYEKNWHGGDPIDFRGLYVQTLLFFEDQPSYNDSVAHEKWDELKQQEGFSSNTDLGDEFYSIVNYPPQSPVMLFWLKYFSWLSIRWIWWAICLLSFIYILYRINCISQSALIICLALGSKAAFSALSLGQPLLPVFALILISFSYLERKPLLAGILLGLSLLKFTVVLPFALFLLIRKRFKVLLTMAISGVLLLIPALIQNPDVISEFLQRADQFFAFLYQPHPLNIYTYSNSDISILLDYYFSAPAGLWTKLGLTFQIASAGILALLYHRKQITEIALLSLLILSSFFFSYHLTYDALLFLLPMAYFYRDNKAMWVSSIWFIILSLPINAVVGTGNLLSFNYPILVLAAIIFIIFAWRNKYPEYRITHTSN